MQFLAQQIPRLFTSHQSQQFQQNSQTAQEESNQTISYETFFIKSRQAHAQQQQQRQENDT
jgi:hypothetical protein